jgi:tetratricopeptide (TPR) repeat protein
VAIDRDETLRKAEKLLRQGNLPGAIAEYVRVSDEFPADANTLNKLAELYQRSGQTDLAVTTYTRVADHWLREGLYGKAAAHYKKVLKLRPNEETALLQLVQASIRQGSLVEAKGYLRIARDAREARGDRPGADQLTLQLADLDPSDFDAKLKGIRVRLAQEPSRSMVGEVRAAIAELEKAGRGGEAEDLLAGLIKLDPDNIDARVQVVEAAMRRGDDAAARAALPANPEESHRPEVVALAAELELKAGRLDAAAPLLQRLLSLDRSRGRVTIRELGERLRPVNLAIAYACVESVVDDQISAREFVDASEALKRFIKLSPHHVPALLRLVEVAVDGDLEKDVTLAQRQLADAYLVEGEAMKARVIAEDLLSRDPRSLSERKRLHRALVALGEDDPDAIITDLLSDQLGLGDDLTPIDDTEDDEAAQAELSAAHETHETPETSEPSEGTEGAAFDAHTQPAAETHAATDPGGDAGLAPDAHSHVDSHVDSAGHDSAGHHGDDSHGDDSQGDDDGDHGYGDGFGSAAAFLSPVVDEADGVSAPDVADRTSAAAFSHVGEGEGAHEDAHDARGHGLEHATPSYVAPEAFAAPDTFDAIGSFGAVEPPPSDALFPHGVDDHELPDLGAVAAAGSHPVHPPEPFDTPESPAWPAPESDSGLAFDPEPVDFLPTDHDLPGVAGLGAEHGPDLLPAVEPPVPNHVSPDVPIAAVPGGSVSGGAFDRASAEAPAAAAPPVGSSATARHDDALDEAEIDLTGALNALAKNGVSISEALDAVMPPVAAAPIPAQAGERLGGMPVEAEAFAPPVTPGKDAGHANGSGTGEELDLERVFDGLRSQAAGDMVEMSQPDQSLRLLSMAETYQAAGMFDEARAALEQVASDSRYRFRAAAALGRLFWQQGDADAALRWMELASEAPAPDREAGRALMYELGEKLEQTGETTRALAVFLELLGEQEDYRDVRQRVDRLSRVQAEP